LKLSAELIRIVLRRGSLPDRMTFDIDADPATEPAAGAARAGEGNAPAA
jgi:hypothetical protein